MVRNIAGTLLLIGKGTLPPEEMVEILEKKDRACAGPTAPSQGLYLVGVDYEQGQETGALSRNSADEK
jgi:tRNA pseudouridine38-40 synthase